jgi:hypothetical protein
LQGSSTSSSSSSSKPVPTKTLTEEKAQEKYNDKEDYLLKLTSHILDLITVQTPKSN